MSPNVALPPRGVLSHRGKGNHGSIHYYRQLHDIPDATEQQRNEVAASQRVILDQLLLAKHADVFVEYFHERDDGPSGQDIATEAGKVLFFGYRRGQILDSFQKQFLVKRGAGVAYRCIAPLRVTLHRTGTIETEEKLHYYIRDQREGIDFSNLSGFQRKLIFDDREVMALRFIKDYMLKCDEPQKKVALIYGAAHDFRSHLPVGEFNPELYEYQCAFRESTSLA